MNFPELPDGDILIVAGDATHLGEIDEIVEFNAWLGKQTFKTKLFIPGNHDFLFESNERLARELLPNATVLIDEYIEVEGLKIYGTPYVNRFYDWAFMKGEAQLAYDHWSKIPEGLDILITHGPPFSILDRNGRMDFCGSTTLYEAVKRLAPKIHVFGHIHESYGREVIEGTTFLNVSHSGYFMNEGNLPVVFEF